MLVEAADEREELLRRGTVGAGVSGGAARGDGCGDCAGAGGGTGEIDRVFREVLAPELEDIRAGDETGPYEFSLGVALAETPMVATALDLLRWVAGALPLERVSGLLLSPYFRGGGRGAGGAGGVRCV